MAENWVILADEHMVPAARNQHEVQVNQQPVTLVAGVLASANADPLQKCGVRIIPSRLSHLILVLGLGASSS